MVLQTTTLQYFYNKKIENDIQIMASQTNNFVTDSEESEDDLNDKVSTTLSAFAFSGEEVISIDFH